MSIRPKNHKSTVISSLFMLIIACIWIFNAHSNKEATDADNGSIHSTQNSTNATKSVDITNSTDTITALPYQLAAVRNQQSEQVITHIGYTVSFNPEWNIPNWVAYVLTKEETMGTEARAKHFLPDPQVTNNPVVTSDYSHSGYDRGHMAPAADMKWSKQVMQESFYMTNMCPQNHSINAGDWKDLEEFGRDLAVEYDSIHIVCGPIVHSTEHTIGQERSIVVPEAFFKAFLRLTSNGWSAIAYRMPNAPSNQPLMTYMHTIDEIENEIGIDLFYLLPDSIETIIEADYTISDWTIQHD